MLKLHPKSFFIGQNLVYLPHCHSTNDLAMEMGQDEKFKSGTIVVTDYQSAGRGQRGTTWQSESSKNIMMSLLLDTNFLSFDKHFDLSIITALSMYQTLKKFEVTNVKIKWPNDIYILNKKLGGILIENSIRDHAFRCSVIGIGLNLNQTYFPDLRATSLWNEGYTIERAELIEIFCEKFEEMFLQLQDNKDFKPEYYNALLGFNEKRFFKYQDITFEGIIKGVTSFGELMIESDLPNKKFDIKEISFCFD